DLHFGPVPPLTALLGAAQFARRQWTFVAQSGDHVGAAALTIDELMPPKAPRGAGSSNGAEGGPQLEWQDAGGVGPVLECRARRSPVGPLAPVTRHRAKTCVGNEFVRAREARNCDAL